MGQQVIAVFFAESLNFLVILGLFEECFGREASMDGVSGMA